MFSTPRWGHHIFSALPSHDFTSTLALKLFRGEPAISEFDWNFTPSHNSSANVSTGFGPPVRFTAPSTWTWVDHLVSGLRPHTTCALFRLAFATAPTLHLNLACKRNSPVHSTKGTPSPINGL